MRALRAFISQHWVAILLALVPPIAIWYFFQREEKILAIIVEADVPVVSVQQQYADGLTLTYRSKPITSLHVVDLRIRNDGNRPLERSDFDTPLSFAFAGTILSAPIFLEPHPTTLSPELTTIAADVIKLMPLLLNEGDQFILRTFVADRTLNRPSVAVNGRVKGVRDLRIKFRDEETRTWNLFLGILTGILVSLSGVSIVFLANRARAALRLAPALHSAIDRARIIGKRGEVSHRTVELAQRLDIANHDLKTNLLFLRLKIESQLRELARKAGLPDRLQLGPIGRLARVLEERQILPKQVGAAVRDIYPTLSRELHEVESYLSADEFDFLQRLALNTVADLEESLSSYTGGSGSQGSAEVV